MACQMASRQEAAKNKWSCLIYLSPFHVAQNPSLQNGATPFMQYITPCQGMMPPLQLTKSRLSIRHPQRLIQSR